MPENAFRDRLAALAERAAKDADARRADRTPRVGRPAPGDLYRFEGASQLDVCWAIIVELSDLYYAVPVRDGVQAGPADVRVPPSAPCGRLILHCNAGQPLTPEVLAKGRRVGVVPADAVERARQFIDDIIQARLDVPPFQAEVEADPAYLATLDQLERAGEALAAAPASRRPLRWWTIAAAAAVLVAGGIGSWLTLRHRAEPIDDGVRYKGDGQVLALTISRLADGQAVTLDDDRIGTTGELIFDVQVGRPDHLALWGVDDAGNARQLAAATLSLAGRYTRTPERGFTAVHGATSGGLKVGLDPDEGYRFVVILGPPADAEFVARQAAAGDGERRVGSRDVFVRRVTR